MTTGTSTLPQTLLQRSWQRACLGLGATPDEALFGRLLDAYREPQRHYHTLQHLSECIALLEPALPLAEHAGEVEFALWFHDAVYEIGRHDNELVSAQWASRAALELGGDPASAARIDALVMATLHAAEPATRDAQLLVDVDLCILGASSDRFDQYEVQVRAEYADVPDEIFRPRRRALLQTFLARPMIYGTPHFRALREGAARDNLKRSIAALAQV